jgi:hypothetical protein
VNVSQDENQIVHIEGEFKPTLDFYYTLLSWSQYGQFMPEDMRTMLINIKRLLTEKYGEKDFRVRYLGLCIIKYECGEYGSQEKDWVRMILHLAVDPSDPHRLDMTDIKKRMDEIGDLNLYKSKVLDNKKNKCIEDYIKNAKEMEGRDLIYDDKHKTFIDTTMNPKLKKLVKDSVKLR